MYLLTAEEMREMDRRTIETFGLPGRLLMENAGRGAARMLMALYPDIASRSVAVVAGRGNNGGDGFVIARCLAAYGIDVTVYLLTDHLLLKGDAAENFNLLAPLDIPVVEIQDKETFGQHKAAMAHKAIWVDAIFGTGLNADVRGFFKSVIRFINDLNKPVFAVDIPSGLHTDTGQPCGTCIRAAATATFGFAKLGHIIYPGAEYTGLLKIVDIGIPPHIANQVAPGQRLLTADMVGDALAPRPPDAHKGQTGHLLVVAGSPGKTGAAAMTSLSGLRAGAGLVTLGIPEQLNSVLEPQALEVMTYPLPQTSDGSLSDAGGETVLSLLADKQCLAIGPGIGTGAETKQLVCQLITESPVPVVVDADGLNLLADDPARLKKKKAEIILTPHPGEMARLIQSTPAAVQADRVTCARSFARKYRVHVILKGARTVIAHPDGEIYVNPTGNPGMASAGMGDVLTGIVSGLVCQGYSPAMSARLGTYLHGAAGDMLAKRVGPVGFIASDVMRLLPETVQAVAAGEFKDISSQYPADRF